MSSNRWLAAFACIVLIAIAFSFPLHILAPMVKGAVLYDSGDPTPEEQLVLEYINRARSDPVAEGQRLGIDIHEGLENPDLVSPRPPLAMSKILLGTAQSHTQNMYNLNYYSHTDPDGTTPFQRMTNAGYNFLIAGENMAASTGQTTAAELEDFMMVDSGTSGRGHRINLLNINPYPCDNPPCVYSEVGIGYYEGATPNGIGLTSLITEDFGAANTGAFLLGVVYNDLNHNSFYDIGEGIAGVTITPSTGGYYAISSSSGGYAIPIDTSGSITVTASGPGFGPITQTVTLAGTNIKLDFTASSQKSASVSVQTSISTTAATSSTQTTSTPTNSVVSIPNIALIPNSASAGSTISVFGSGFSIIDNSCILTSGVSFKNYTCSISEGRLVGTFILASAGVGSYMVTAAGSPVGDFASAAFRVNAAPTQTTTSTSAHTTLSPMSSTTTAPQPTTVVRTSTVTSTTLISTTSTTAMNFAKSSPSSTSTPMVSTPISGFPLESIVTGIILGLATLALVSRRRR